MMRAIDELPIQPEGEAMVVRFRMIHDIIRQDLAAVRALVGRVLDSATPDAVRAELAELSVSSPIRALRTYCLQYCQFVHGHHTHEDHTWFPHLRAVNPALTPAIDRLKAEHETVAVLLDTIAQHARALQTNEYARDSLAAALSDLADHLVQHLDWEEDAIFPTIRRMSDWRQTLT